MRKMMILLLTVVVCSFWLSNVLVLSGEKDVFYQGGTYAALYAGNYNQVATVGQIKEKGNFGLGVFDLLDGDMIVLDGKVYQADSSGNVTKVKNDAGVPFYEVVNFQVDSEKELGSVESIRQLYNQLDRFRKRDDVIYAIRIEGTFPQIKTAAFSRQYYPYPNLAEAAERQGVFHYENVTGTLVGFWLPDCVDTMNQPGYHFHFLSDDRQKGGHLLELEMEKGIGQFDEIVEMNIAFSGVMTTPLAGEQVLPTMITRQNGLSEP